MPGSPMFTTQEAVMPSMKKSTMIGAAAAVAVAGVLGLSQSVIAQSPTADVVGELAVSEGIFVDGKTFKIAKGKAKGDPTAQMAKLGAREIGPGVILFRHGDKLFMAETAAMPTPQAMKSFQDEWSVGYMKAFKEFQDQWAVSYMKKAQASPTAPSAKDQLGVDQYQSAMKSFQDEWSVGYMKAMNNFQDQWAVSYMKNFQDNWAVSYMNGVKNFQDTFSTMYMK
jgi:hypothetical protein